MRLISLGYRKVKAVQCYLSLLVWLILVSIGLYWFLNRNGSEHTTQSQPGQAGYQDGQPVYQDSGESSGGRGEGLNKDILNNKYASFAPATATKHSKIHDIASNRNDEKDKRTKSLGEKVGRHQESDNVVNRLCNPLNAIKANEENVKDPDFKLEAVVILFRHGDRGPLTHIGHRNVSHINCEAKTPEFEQLTKFVTDTLLKLPGYSQFIGPFHSFPKVPSSPFCSLGQLSQLGSAQLLTLGKLVRTTYRSSLVNLTSFNNHDVSQSSLKVVAYSTRYRRTFQSLFAFLYGLLGPRQLIQSTTIHESQSIAFCFKHCSCKAADRLKKAANKKFKPNQTAKEIMARLVAQLNAVLGTEKSKKTGSSLLDSLLVYPCHNKELPCHQDKRKDTKVQLLFRTIKNFSLYNHHTSHPISKSCVTFNHLKTLVELINQENEGLTGMPESHKYHLLNSYGLLKEIVNLALRMTTSLPPSRSDATLWRKQQQQTPLLFQPDSAFTSSFTNINRNFFRSDGGNNRPGKLVVFSGHDTTLQSLTAALGILQGEHVDAHLPPFGSRLIFEFYRKVQAPPNSPRKLHFRVVYNGIAVTHLVSFCKEHVTDNYAGTSNSDSIKTAKQSNSKIKVDNKMFFCPIENLVRFIHDNYFSSFDNATSFKDACKKSSQ